MLIFFCFGLVILLFTYQFIVSFIPFSIPLSYLRKKKDITGLRILITGAGSGLGRQLAIQFSKYHTRLILVDINKQSLLETEKLIGSKSTVFIYECDVSDYKKVYEMAQTVKKEVGDVDILVNNAGVVSGKYLMDLPEEKIVKTFEVNALAHFWTCKAFLPAMIARNRGHVVSVASLCGRWGFPQLTDYCASKFAAVGFAESLEYELRQRGARGVKVTIVLLAHMNTELFQGVTFPSFVGILSTETVAKKILQGVLAEQETIILPQFIKFPGLFKEFFSRWFLFQALNYTGILRFMESFKGRMSIKEPEGRLKEGRCPGETRPPIFM